LREENVNLIVKAVKDYKESKNLENLLEIIRGYSELGFFGEVKKYMEEFIGKGGNVGDLVKNSKDMPEEIRDIICSGKVEIDEEFDADSFLEMGELLWEIGSPDEAKDNYLKAFEYYVFLGNKNAAEQVLKTLKQNYPDDRDIKALVFKDAKQEVVSNLKAYIAEPPEDEADLRYALGKSFYGENLLPEAESNYRRILELDDTHRAKRLLVALLRDKGSFEESLELARELRGAEKLEELYSISQSLRDSGKTREGEVVLKEIYRIDPDFKNVRELLGMPRTARKEEEEEEIEKVYVDAALKKEKKVKVGDSGKRNEDFEGKKIVFL
jgi:tetratricopeptide (TPR) repeat protein